METRYTPAMSVLVAVRDMLLRSRITETAQRIGVPIQIARRGVPFSVSVTALGHGAAIVDLAEPGILTELQRAKDVGGVRVIGFLGHLQTDLAEAALASGADQVLSRGQLVSRLEDVLRAAAGLVPAEGSPGSPAAS